MNQKLPPFVLFLAMLAVSFFAAACNQGSQSGDSPAGRIIVITEPDSAEITFNGRLAGMEINGVAAGDHLITASRPGYRTARKTVTVFNQEVSITMRLEPVRGLLLVESEPSGAQVKVGTIATGNTPLLVPDCPLGTYPVSFSKIGYKSSTVQVTIDSRVPKKVFGELQSNTGGLSIRSFPEGAAVTLDGGRKGVTPVTIENLDTGRYDIALALDGYKPYSERVSILAGESASVQAEMVALPGGIRVSSVPTKARVYLDDQLKGETIAHLRPVEPGTHTLKIEKTGYETMSRTVTVERGKDITETFELVKNAGKLVVTTYPAGVTVIVDGEKAGVTKPRRSATDNASEVFEVDMLTKGVHTLQLVRDKHETHKEEFEISGDEAVTISQELKRLFVEDWVIWVRGRRWVGSKVEKHINGDVTMETAPGIVRRFLASEIQKQEAYVKKQ